MQAHKRGQVPGPLVSIPWWQDLEERVLKELALAPYQSLALASPVIDVAVIGGGVAGLSAALSVGQAGARVVLLEGEASLGRGATGRNAGILSAGVNMGIADLPPGGEVAAFWPETTRILLGLVEEASKAEAVLVARLTGALSLAESANAVRVLAREARSRVAAGLRAELWEPEQVAQHTGGRLNSDTVKAALWLPDEGRIQPLTLLAHLARQARGVGAQLVGGAFVVHYEEVSRGSGPPVWQLTLADQSVLHARHLILAVGPTVQPNARIYALAFKAELPDDFPLFWDASPYTYADFRPGQGRLTVSGGKYGKAGVGRRDAVYYNRLAEAARRWLPELAGQTPAYTWAVDLAVTAQMVPHVRALGEKARGFAIEGLGALGVLPGMALGERVAGLL